MKNLLLLLDREVGAIPEGQKGAYINACRLCPDQVDNERKSAFLWREEFDLKVRKTAGLTIASSCFLGPRRKSQP